MKQRSYLALEGITVEFPTRAGRFCALDGIDLEVEKGQFVALIGHSGCGKSTLLNAVAGLVKPTRGAIFLDGELVDAPGPPIRMRLAPLSIQLSPAHIAMMCALEICEIGRAHV